MKRFFGMPEICRRLSLCSPEVSSPCGRKGAEGRKTAISAFTEELRQNGVETEIAQTIADKIIPLMGRNEKRKPSQMG